MPGVSGETPEIGEVDGSDDRAASKVGDGDDESVHRQLRCGAGGPEELSCPDSDPGVDGVDLDPFASQAREDLGVGSSSPDNLGEHCGDRRHG